MVTESPSTRISRPITSGSALRWVRQYVSVSTTTRLRAYSVSSSVKNRPRAGAIPSVLAVEAVSGPPRWTREDLWSALSIRTSAYTRDGVVIVELAPLRDPLLPDLLVYWAPGGPGDRLPDGARLLGRLAGTATRRFALPAAGGRLHLYSLGHARLVDSAALPDAG